VSIIANKKFFTIRHNINIVVKSNTIFNDKVLGRVRTYIINKTIIIKCCSRFKTFWEMFSQKMFWEMFW